MQIAWNDKVESERQTKLEKRKMITKERNLKRERLEVEQLMRHKGDIEKFNSDCQIGELEEQRPTTSSDQPGIIQLQRNMLNIELVASASIRNSISS